MKMEKEWIGILPKTFEETQREITNTEFNFYV